MKIGLRIILLLALLVFVMRLGYAASIVFMDELPIVIPDKQAAPPSSNDLPILEGETSA